MGKNYAQNNKHMRNMEKEAYLEGNMCFRDWEDGLHDKEKILIKIAENKFLKENKQMSVKINKKFLKETIVKLLNKKVLNEKDELDAAGMKIPKTKEEIEKKIAHHKDVVKNLEDSKQEAKINIADPAEAAKELRLTDRKISARRKAIKRLEKQLGELESKDASQETQSESKGAFAPSHYCIHHGGVQHEGAIYQGEAIGHNWNEELGRVTHYDMKLADGTILEDVAEEDILVTKASLAEGSYTLVGECSHKRHGIKRKKDKKDLEEELGDGKIDPDDDKKANLKGANPKQVGRGDVAAEAGARGKKERQEESKIQTPEQEENLYEQRFTKKNTKLFERLLKEWTK
tara:strand:- start:276 stop:1313 length:1038 start_codon:yes stop_codon:yes gene_type:complete